MTLCTRCQTSVLPVVAVDIDGTLAHYHEPLRRLCGKYWNLNLPLTFERRQLPDGSSEIVDNRWNGVGNYEDFLGITQEQYREAKLAYRQGGYKRFAEPYDGAIGFMRGLGALPVEIWITTTRPWNRLDSVDPDTRFWLDRHQIPYHHLLYDDHKYLRLAELVDPARVIAVVEDLPEMLDEAVTVFERQYIYRVRRPHNQLDHRRGWVFEQIMENISADADRWQHG